MGVLWEWLGDGCLAPPEAAGRAEAAAKAALILGHASGLEWLDARPWLAGMLVLEDGTTLASRRIHEYLWELK